MILQAIKAKTLQVGAAGGEGTILWIQVARGQKNYGLQLLYQTLVVQRIRRET